MTKDHLAALAVEVLTFLGEDQDRLVRFLDQTGLTPQSIASGIRQEAFHKAVMSYLAQDETLLLAFSRSSSFDLDDITDILAQIDQEQTPDVP